MMSRQGPQIRRFGSACLRRQAVPADAKSPATQELLDRMWEVLLADGGVGLAAPQIDENVRLVVVRDPDRPIGEQRLDFVNPVVTRRYGPEKYFNEGCLSFPGLYAHVLRREGIEFSFESADSGDLTTQKDHGLLARIIQHEVDHLDGVLFIDHLSVWDRLMLGPQLLRILLRRCFRR
ncbi:MAG: peptide deformylase [Candidatus Krumholzibacteriia bacterium]|jgi:peptide deformylase